MLAAPTGDENIHNVDILSAVLAADVHGMMLKQKTTET